MDYNKFKYFAEDMANNARKIALKYFRQSPYNMGINIKSDNTPVTNADKEIEQLCRNMIADTFPTHGVLGEEEGADRIDADFVWVIDPIDGTKAFATGKPLFGTIIGLTHNKKPVLGLIDQAFTQERWLGIEGYQTTHNNKQIRVSKVQKLNEASFYTAAPEMFPGVYVDRFDKLKSKLKWVQYSTDCYAYGLLSMGCVDIVMEQFLGHHDIIGLLPIIKNAGGFASDWNGKEINLNTNGTLIAASNEKLAKQVLDIINSK